MNDVLPLRLTGDPLLRRKAAMVADPTDPALKELACAMLVTLRAFDGVGIAAPQVGYSLRLVIIASQPNSRYPNAPCMEPVVMLNPQIISRSTEMAQGMEGCLSVPGTKLQVLRHNTVKVCWQDLDGQQLQQEMYGFVARIVQHELDHLEGILFPDRAP